MREKGKKVDYLLAKDEGHGFAKPLNKKAMYAKVEQFLSETLGGRYQKEMSDDVKSTLQNPCLHRPVLHFLWLCLFFGGYIWMVVTGNEQLVLERGRALYKLVADWLEDADVDFQIKEEKSVRKKNLRPKRWE